MSTVKRSLLAALLLLGIVLGLPSCSSHNFFKETPVEQVETHSPADGPDAVTTEKEADIESLEEKIVLLENKVNTLESRMAGQKNVVYTIEYSDPAQLYQQARQLLVANKIKDAADLFSTFVEKHPGHSLADNALYWLGECYYTRGSIRSRLRYSNGWFKPTQKRQRCLMPF